MDGAKEAADQAYTDQTEAAALDLDDENGEETIAEEDDGKIGDQACRLATD